VKKDVCKWFLKSKRYSGGSLERSVPPEESPAEWLPGEIAIVLFLIAPQEPQKGRIYLIILAAPGIFQAVGICKAK